MIFGSIPKSSMLLVVLFILLGGLIFSPGSAQAQVASWTFSQASGTFTPLAGGTTIAIATVGGSGATSLDDVVYTVPAGTIPFFWNGYNGFYVCTNGWLAFGGPGQPGSSMSPISGTSVNDLIVASMAADLQGLVTAGTLGEIKYDILGSAPNRIFVVEFKNFRYYGSSGENYTFQFQLKEDNSASVIYGPMTITSSASMQVGMRGTTNADYNNRTTTTDWTATTAGGSNSATCSWSTTVYPPSGLTFKWTPPAQSYGSTTTTQITGPVIRGITSQPVIRVEVTMNNSGSPMSLTQLNCSTNGTSSLSDIENARIYFTGTSPVFNTSAQYGSTIAAPSTGMTFTGAQQLSGGTNYFWLTYDVKATATIGNVVDGECSQVTVVSNYTPTVTAPAGNRPIKDKLSGAYTIDQLGSGTTNYTSFTAAITDLNSLGFTGNVVFNVAPGQTFSENPPMITASGTASSTITFQKGGPGPNPIISATGTTGSYDYIIALLGTDYLTLDGITLQDASNLIEYGIVFLMKSPTDGCQYNVIRNCTIDMNKTNTSSMGIRMYYWDQTLASTLVPTSPSGTHSFNKIYGNTITDFGSYGIYLYGYPASAPYSLYNQNNEIGVDGGNQFTDFGGGSTRYCLYAAYNNNLKVANNSFVGGTGNTSSTYAMYFATAYNANLDVYNNLVTLTTSYYDYGIYISSFGGTGNSNTLNIYNNTITGCTTGSSSYIYSIYMSTNPYQLNVYGNTITNNTSSYYFYGIYQSSSPYNYNCFNNMVANNTAASTGYMYCMYTSTVYNALNWYGNTVHDNTGSYYVYSMYISPTSSTVAKVYNNRVYNQLCNGTYYVYGLYFSSGLSFDVFNNYFNGLKTDAGASTGGYVYGIYMGSAAPTVNIYNNFIADLQTPKGSSTTSIYGMYLATTSGGAVTSVYHNSIYMNASSTYSTFGCAGIYASTSGFLDLRNNIVVNNSIPMGTGRAVAYYRSSTTLTTYLPSSGNNCFYAGTPGTYNNIYYDGSNADQTIGAFRTRVSPRDQQSFSELPPFINVATAPFDLHINAAAATLCEANGQVLPAVVTDFDGNPRCPNAGCGGGKLFPDVGADEFSGTATADLLPPLISYIPFGSGAATASRTLPNVVISDASGVNGTFGTRPRCYYKKSTDLNDATGWKYVEATGTTSPFTFNIDYTQLNAGSVSVGDVIQYFVVAQDLAPTPNVGINAGGFAATPSTVALTSAAYPIGGTINQYSIIANTSAFCGSYNIGTGQTYTTLKSFFDAINSGVVTCNVTANIVSDLTETATCVLYPVNVDPPSAAWTITVQPSGNAARTISGSISGGLIQLYGADNVIFDGLNSGGNSLTLVNNTASYYTVYLTNYGSGLNPGTTNDVFRNCTIKGASNTSTSYAVYITGADNDNITFQNNLFARATYALYISGSTAGFNDNMIVKGNTFGGPTAADAISYYGMYMTYNNNAQVTDNDFAFMQGSTSYAATFYCIYMSSYCFNTTIARNKMHNCYNYYPSSYGAVGIYLSTTTIINPLIVNNMLYDFKTGMYSTGVTSNPLGFYVAAGTNIRMYNNTVYFSGPTLPNGTASTVSLPIYISGFQGLDMRNNIFANSMTSGVSGLSHTNYSIYYGGGGLPNTVDNNNYFASGSSAMMGYGGGAFLGTLADLKNFTQQDQNSWAVDPQFVSGTDAHLVSGTTPNPMESGAVTLAQVPNDIDGQARPGPAGSVNGGGLAPDIGADEFDGKPNLFLAGTLPSVLCGGSSVTIPFSVGVSFNTGNLFIAQLSDATGSFAAPVNIGSVAGTGSGSIAGTIPLGTPAGTGYRIRVIGTSPGYTGGASAPFQVSSPALLPPTLPLASVFVPYSASFTGTGGSAPYTITLSGTLPPGLGFSSPTISGIPTAEGSWSFTVTVTDAIGCTNTYPYTLTVISAACTLTCPANIVVSNTTNQCGAVVTYPAPTWTGSCGTVTCSPASGSFFPKGTTTVTCTPTTGNPCSFTITVNDTQPPTIACPANIVVGTAPNACSAPVSYATPVASDNCPGIQAVVCTPASGSTFAKGTTTVTCTVRDAVNNSAACSFTVTVNDTQAPSIVCPPTQYAESDATCNGINVSYPAPTITDNCPGAYLYSATYPSGYYFPVGTTVVTLTARDASGNSSSCSFNVNIESRAKIAPVADPVVFGFGCKEPKAYQKNIRINNGGGHFGGGVMVWNATTSAAEITLVTASGVEGDSLRIKVNPAGLAAGTYTRTITISAQNSVSGAPACNSPYTMTIKIIVEPAGNVTQTRTLTPGSWISFTNSLGQTVADIKNNLSTPIDFTVNCYTCQYPGGMTRLRYIQRWYSFSSTAAARNIDARLYWTNSEMVGISLPYELKIYQQPAPGGIWVNLGGTPDPPTNTILGTGIINTNGVFAIAHRWTPKVMAFTLISALYDYTSQRSVIQWTSPLITDEQGFYLERSTRGGIEDSWETVGTVGYNPIGDYGFSEKLTEQGRYLYRLFATDREGNEYESEPFAVEVGNMPGSYVLEQNYPNPFNPTTVIRYAIPENAKITLKVYDVFWREVRTLVDEEKAAGRHEATFDASALPSGTYYYKLEAGSFVQVRKMNLTK